VTFGTAFNKLAVYYLAGSTLPLGQSNVVATVSGLTANAAGFWMMLTTSSYAGALSISPPVLVTGDTVGATVNNSVTVTSVSPAHRVVTVHAVPHPNLFSGYNLISRAVASGQYAYVAYLLEIFGVELLPYTSTANDGELLLGDSPGAASVTGTAIQPSTALWGAIGFDIAPAPVIGAGYINTGATLAATGSVSRVQPPAPWRTWVLGT
jgi:hypothetical protein